MKTILHYTAAASFKRCRVRCGRCQLTRWVVSHLSMPPASATRKHPAYTNYTQHPISLSQLPPWLSSPISPIHSAAPNKQGLRCSCQMVSSSHPQSRAEESNTEDRQKRKRSPSHSSWLLLLSSLTSVMSPSSATSLQPSHSFDGDDTESRSLHNVHLQSLYNGSQPLLCVCLHHQPAVTVGSPIRSCGPHVGAVLCGGEEGDEVSYGSRWMHVSTQNRAHCEGGIIVHQDWLSHTPHRHSQPCRTVRECAVEAKSRRSTISSPSSRTTGSSFSWCWQSGWLSRPSTVQKSLQRRMMRWWVVSSYSACCTTVSWSVFPPSMPPLHTLLTHPLPLPLIKHNSSIIWLVLF